MGGYHAERESKGLRQWCEEVGGGEQDWEGEGGGERRQGGVKWAGMGLGAWDVVVGGVKGWGEHLLVGFECCGWDEHGLGGCME